MSHPSYPTRALAREWRVGYKRSARRLVLAFVVSLALWLGAVRVVVDRMVDGVRPPSVGTPQTTTTNR